MVVLISILLPSLAIAKEATNRLRCSNNMKQFGGAMAMYASDYGDLMPYSVFGDPSKGIPEPENTLYVHLQSHERAPVRSWDGLGILSDFSYIDHPQAYYCPSHPGDHTLKNYANSWASGSGQIASNYQFRLFTGRRYMSQLDAWSALIADGMRTPTDYNHGDGNNMLQAGMAVVWVPVQVLPEQLLADFSSKTGMGVVSSGLINQSWLAMDRVGSGRTDPGLAP